MMIQLIVLGIFLFSFLGMTFILIKKMPALIRLPQNGHHGIKKHKVILHVEGKLKSFHFDIFHKQVWLHKLLSLVKIWTLKLETKIDTLLHGIRKKAQKLDREVQRKK
jgi:hypothetical protein